MTAPKAPLGAYPLPQEQVLVNPKPGTPGFQGTYTPSPQYRVTKSKATSQPAPNPQQNDRTD